MLDNIRFKFNIVISNDSLSSGSKLFYTYLLFNLDSDLLINFDSNYFTDLFHCSLKTLYNWIHELEFFNFIKFSGKLIHVYF